MDVVLASFERGVATGTGDEPAVVGKKAPVVSCFGMFGGGVVFDNLKFHKNPLSLII